MGAVKAQLLDREERVTCPTCKGEREVWYAAHRVERYAWPDEPDGVRTRVDRFPTPHRCGQCDGFGYISIAPITTGEPPLPF